MLNPLLLPVLSIFDFHLMIYAYVPRYFLENTLSLHVIENLGTEPMEDIDEGIEEGSEREHNTEGKGSSYAKKTRAATPAHFAHLKAKNALNRHFYKNTAELRMVELINKPIRAEKRITQESLEQYNVMELLLGMSCVELALFAEQFNENLVKEFYVNLTEEVGNLKRQLMTILEEEVDFEEVTKVLTGDAGAVWPETNKFNSNLMKMPYRALFRENDQHLYCYLEKHPQADRPNEGLPGSSHLKRSSPAPSWPPPSTDSSEVTTILDLLNQQLSNVMASVLQMQQDLESLKDKLP
ncbi:hypothetical protein M9H77_17081 [Catharanthus roseus]|uniref:Uncharacterized protein n=1 Tax=Catharanthus roseus TaxID=4058 RepID=A0ACC0B3M0_CATRO|nr:hypothetical protein M9H77_17081 [Catharanthus roseus]